MRSAFTGCSGMELMWHVWQSEAGQQLTLRQSVGRMLACRYVEIFTLQQKEGRPLVWTLPHEDQLKVFLLELALCLYSWNQVTGKMTALVCSLCAIRFIRGTQLTISSHPVRQCLLFQPVSFAFLVGFVNKWSKPRSSRWPRVHSITPGCSPWAVVHIANHTAKWSGESLLPAIP